MTTEPSKYKRAIGLRYTRDHDDAPSIHIFGEELHADAIVKTAKRFGIPIIERPELAQALAACELDTAIPVEVFEAVALILAQLERENN